MRDLREIMIEPIEGTIDEIADALVDGDEISFYGSDNNRAAPAPFTIQSVLGGFKVRGSGRHLGSFADFEAALACGLEAADRARNGLSARDPWGKDFPATLALLKR